jgi:hypothetical protein
MKSGRGLPHSKTLARRIARWGKLRMQNEEFEI